MYIHVYDLQEAWESLSVQQEFHHRLNTSYLL